MYTVRLNGLKYSAFIGLYPQEHLIANDFEIDIEVTIDCNLVASNELSNLIDYGFLKEVADKYMKPKSILLEDILAKISIDILEKYPNSKGKIRLKKYSPPFGGRCASAEVEYQF